MTIKIRQRPKEDYRSKTSGERQKRAESKSKKTFYHRNLSIPKDSRFTSKQSQREREKKREREGERERGGGEGEKIREGLNRGEEERRVHKVSAIRTVGANFHFFRLFTPPLLCFVKSAMAGTTSSLVHFRWISSFIGFPFHAQLSFFFSALPPPPHASVSLLLLLFPPRWSSSFPFTLQESSLFLYSSRTRSPPSLAPTISRRSPPATLDTSGHGRSPYVTDTIPLE